MNKTKLKAILKKFDEAHLFNHCNCNGEECKKRRYPIKQVVKDIVTLEKER